MRASWRAYSGAEAACTMAPDAAASSIPAVAERQVMGELRPGLLQNSACTAAQAIIVSQQPEKCSSRIAGVNSLQHGIIRHGSAVGAITAGDDAAGVPVNAEASTAHTLASACLASLAAISRPELSPQAARLPQCCTDNPPIATGAAPSQPDGSVQLSPQPLPEAESPGASSAGPAAAVAPSLAQGKRSSALPEVQMTCHVLHTTHQQREKGLQFTHICTQGILQDVQRAEARGPGTAAGGASCREAARACFRAWYEATVLGWRRREAALAPLLHRRLRRYTSPEAHHEPCFLSDPLQSTRGATAWGACLSHQTALFLMHRAIFNVASDAQGSLPKS